MRLCLYAYMCSVCMYKDVTYITPATYFMPLYRVQILLKVEPGDGDKLVSLCEAKQEHNDESEAMEEGRHAQVDLLSPCPSHYLSHTATQT